MSMQLSNNLFERNAATADGGAIQTSLQQARRELGYPAGWRLKRQADALRADALADALAQYMQAQREQLAFAVRLSLDEAKKRLVKENLGATAVIEREIAGLVAQAGVELEAQVETVSTEAAREEVRRKRAIEAALAAGEIEQRRAATLVAQAERATDEILHRAETVAQRIIRNLGERLERALAPAATAV